MPCSASRDARFGLPARQPCGRARATIGLAVDLTGVCLAPAEIATMPTSATAGDGDDRLPLLVVFCDAHARVGSRLRLPRGLRTIAAASSVHGSRASGWLGVSFSWTVPAIRCLLPILNPPSCPARHLVCWRSGCAMSLRRAFRDKRPALLSISGFLLITAATCVRASLGGVPWQHGCSAPTCRRPPDVVWSSRRCRLGAVRGVASSVWLASALLWRSCCQVVMAIASIWATCLHRLVHRLRLAVHLVGYLARHRRANHRRKPAHESCRTLRRPVMPECRRPPG